MASKKNKGSSKYPAEILVLVDDGGEMTPLTDAKVLEVDDEVGVYKLVDVKRADITLSTVK